MSEASSYSSLSALQRAQALLDADTFVPLEGLADSLPLVLGEGAIGGKEVLLALIDGHVRGGTIGLREAAILAKLEQIAAQKPTRPLILGFDSGGVRVEEGPRALAAVSAVGVALARLTLIGVPVVAVISGPRGCFGALAVMAALPEHVIITENASWGLTGPKILSDLHQATDADVHAATSAATRRQNGDAHDLVADDPHEIRAGLLRFLQTPRAEVMPIAQRITVSTQVTAELRERLRKVHPAVNQPLDVARNHRQRDLLRFSFRGEWHPSRQIQRAGLVHAALGTLGTHPALGLIVGPEQLPDGGVGIEEAAVVTDMLRLAVAQEGEPAVILIFLFCQGHAVDHRQERFGLHRALAECLRAMVAARLLGHPIASVLGGGTYGAAYLSLAAPSHRIFAMQGTSVAPMAPPVLRAFQTLRGQKPGQEAASQLAELIPEIRIVESVIRLPRVLRDELTALLERVRRDATAA